MTRIEEEKLTVSKMIHLYCRKKHLRNNLCTECDGLHDYAMQRLDHCKFGEEKPVCAKCPVHCYKPDRREQIRVVMRFSGPRMMLNHPWLSIMHTVRKLR